MNPHQLIIHLHIKYTATVLQSVFGDNRTDLVKPGMRLLQEKWMQIRNRAACQRTARDISGQNLGILTNQPGGKAIVAKLRILVGSRAANYINSHFTAQLQKFLQLQPRSGIKVKYTFFRLVEQPGDIGGGA